MAWATNRPENADVSEVTARDLSPLTARSPLPRKVTKEHVFVTVSWLAPGEFLRTQGVEEHSSTPSDGWCKHSERKRRQIVAFSAASLTSAALIAVYGFTRSCCVSGWRKRQALTDRCKRVCFSENHKLIFCNRNAWLARILAVHATILRFVFYCMPWIWVCKKVFLL